MVTEPEPDIRASVVMSWPSVKLASSLEKSVFQEMQGGL